VGLSELEKVREIEKERVFVFACVFEREREGFSLRYIHFIPNCHVLNLKLSAEAEN